jgi:flavin-dependent dehydrogenase
VCGGCLGPRALDALARIGFDASVLPSAAPIERTRVAASGAHAELELPSGMAVDRSELDAALLDRAAEAGVDVRQGCRARIDALDAAGRLVGLVRDDQRESLRTRLVVDATGLQRAGAGDDSARVGLGATEHTELGPPASTVWMAADRGDYVGMARYRDGRLNVAASVAAGSLVEAAPGDVVDRILTAAGLDPLGWEAWSGTPPLRTRPLDRVRARVLPCGDAAGFWEPFTGEGIGWGLAAGLRLADTAQDLVDDWNDARAARWLRDQADWLRAAQAKSRRVAALTDRPRLARWALGLLNRAPAAGRWLVPGEGRA